ncbi:MAG: hypothetical protein JWM27_238 [Gemmatimonadetes bacterium]|nr:hypothetical protein [Gemmatimonadota bacterium]
MSTEALPISAPRRDQGFSLVEVLFAFLIVAVGLLSLEGLGFLATRQVARASAQTKYVSAATDTLEQLISRTRNGESPSSATYTVYGASMRTVVATVGARRDISVSVYPSTANKNFTAGDSVRLSASVYYVP